MLLRFYRLYLQILPREFREEFGEEMCRVVAEHWEAERRTAGRWGASRFWLRQLLGVTRQAVSLRTGARGGRHSSGSGRDSPMSEFQRKRSTLPLLDQLRQDVSYAVRGIRRSPGFSAMVVSTLALGVGANAAMFSALDGIFGVPPGLNDPGSLRRLYYGSGTNRFGAPSGIASFNHPSFAAIQAATRGEADVAAWIPSDEVTIRSGEVELAVRAAWVGGGFFEVLGVDAAQGRLLAPDEGRIDVPARVVVVSHALWERAFASDPTVLGRSVELEDASYTVVGITAKGFTGLDLSYTDLFFPMSTYPGGTGPAGLTWYQWGAGYLRLIARLGQADEAAFSSRATAGYRNQPPIPYFSSDTAGVVHTGPVVEARGPGHQDGAIPISTRAAGITLLVLLIASANVACLLLVRATRRRQEMAVRVALGVSRRRLFSQLLIESLVLALLSGAAACALGAWGGSVLRGLLLPSVAWAQPSMEPRTVLLVLLGASATGLLAGLAPGLHAWRVQATSLPRASIREGGVRRSSARSILLVAQAALSVVLLVGAGLFFRSLGRLDALDLGYDVDRVVRASVPRQVVREQPEAMAGVAFRLRELGDVMGVALATSPPMSGYESSNVYLAGQQTPIDPPPTYNDVSPEFFDVAGMGMVAGRTFAPGEDGVIIVNQTMAETVWPGPVVFHILLALAEGDRHGYGVVQAVREHSDGRVALTSGSFYRHLGKLLDDGFVAETAARPQDDDPRRGTYYRLTPEGRELLVAESRRMADLAAVSRKLGLLPGVGRR